MTVPIRFRLLFSLRAFRTKCQQVPNDNNCSHRIGQAKTSQMICKNFGGQQHKNNCSGLSALVGAPDMQRRWRRSDPRELSARQVGELGKPRGSILPKNEGAKCVTSDTFHWGGGSAEIQQLSGSLDVWKESRQRGGKLKGKG